MYDYIVISSAVTDNVCLPNGDIIRSHLGGAGIYAYCGIRLWTESVLQATGVGADFARMYGDWYTRNQCAQEGLLIKDPYTPVCNIRYSPDGERIESTPYGEAHYQKMELSLEEVEPFLSGAKGVYVFKGLSEAYWEKLLKLKKWYGFCLEWELNAAFAQPLFLEEVRRIATQCDIFSLNQTEARQLFKTAELDAVARELGHWRVPMVYLRTGNRGAFVISGGEILQIPCALDVSVKDPTGAGNSSSGAVLYAWCNGDSLQMCGIRGSISAACCIEQFGPPDFTEEKIRAVAEKTRTMNF